MKQWDHAELGDPADAALQTCESCKRKTDGTVIGTLRIWRCRYVPPRTWTDYRGEERHTGGWWVAYVRCLDRQGCSDYLHEQAEKRREQAKRRRPDLPHADAPKGSCKWCGEPILFNEDLKGWKRRRQRSYHYGDEWETGDTRCVAHAIAWGDPKRATGWLLSLQGGCCTVCNAQLATPKPWPEHWTEQGSPDVFGVGIWTPNRNVDVDHRRPIWDGGDNSIENLQVICHEPCHARKTAAEAKERAFVRRWEAKVRRGEDPDDCWIWFGAVQPNGYGVLGRGRRGEGNVPAHVASYEIHNGPVPDGLVVDHQCNNRACVNPAHLKAMTQAENCQRGARAKLRAEDVAEIRRRVAAGETQASVARDYDIHAATVSRIVRGERWQGEQLGLA